jgi:predicted peroxiredoxin
MSRYLLIESRDPFESRDTQFVVETATALKRRGNDVTVFLVQNGVLAARRRARGTHLSTLAEEGVRLLADDFSLRERGLRAEDLTDGVKESGIGTLVDMLARRDTKTIWH